MKKQLTAVLMIFALLLILSGCMAANAVQKLDMVEDKVEAKLDAAEDKLEASLRNAVVSAPAPALAESESAPALPAAVSEKAPAAPELPASEKLTEEQALQIALEHLGFRADQVSRLRTEFEIDDGIPQYDIEFHQGDWEYEFEIHGENGKIISYDKDHKYD